LIRTEEFIDDLAEQDEPKTGDKPVPESIDEIAFNRVDFAYEASEQILDEVTFSVHRGEFVAFVGSSGAGKSTIASLVSRLYEPDRGRILANGTPIHVFDIKNWRSRVAVVRQNPFIFNESLRSNLTVGNRDASQSKIERICEIAQVTEFLDDLPNGYNTQLGDDGVRLSGGQRQRVAIARALLKDDIDLLVLDEATSDLDSELEQLVHDAIEEMDRNYAMLVIAHRLSTVKNADRIYALVNGQIVESGTHEELLPKAGVYSELYSTQTTAPQ
jgi:subfamily B ATP-binding cassette protein MsbA